MKIVEKGTKRSTTITTNEIPVGQVFRGNLYGKGSGRWERGIFYKAYGSSAIKLADGMTSADVLVVRLDESHGTPGHANAWLRCSTVQDYEPLDVELVIK